MLKKNIVAGIAVIAATIIDISAMSLKSIIEQDSLNRIIDACYSGNMADVQYFIGSNTELITKADCDGNVPLFIAIKQGKIEVIDFIVEKCDDAIDFLDKEGRTILMHAAFYGHDKIVKLLLEKKAKINLKDKEGRTALMHAIRCRHIEAARLLLMEDTTDASSPDKNGQTPLIHATLCRCIAIINFLLFKKVRISHLDKYGQTALTYVIDNGDTEIAELLIDKCQNIDTVSQGGMTPLMYASKRRNKRIIKLLIDKGADKGKRDKHNKNALMHLYDNQNDDNQNDDYQTEYLLDLLAPNIDEVINPEGQTRLTLAIINEDVYAVRNCLKRNASRWKPDQNGKIPANLSLEVGNKEIIKLINCAEQ